MNPFNAEEIIYLNSHLKNELQKKTATLFYTCVSGAHLYGMESPNSDIDVRGVFVNNTHKLLGLHRPEETIHWDLTQVHPSQPIHSDGLDIEVHEIAKFLSLALKSNCNVLEHLVAQPLYAEPEALEMRKLMLGMMSKNGLYNSYKGMATFNYHKFLKTGKKKTVKKYLYVFRGLLAGMYALQNGQIQPDLAQLSRCYQIPEVKELIKIKQANSETGALPADIDEAKLETVLVDLFERITKAYEKSNLPDKPDEEDVAKVNTWLIKLRKKHLT